MTLPLREFLGAALLGGRAEPVAKVHVRVQMADGSQAQYVVYENMDQLRHDLRSAITEDASIAVHDLDTGVAMIVNARYVTHVWLSDGEKQSTKGEQDESDADAGSGG